MIFSQALSHHFPGAVAEQVYVRASQHALLPLGFTRENAIACAGVCRDEITRPFVDAIQDVWGEAFNFASLAGMLFLGKTGFTAAEQHSPKLDGRERYIFYAFPHIALGESGEVGLCFRTGRDEPSTACGALAALQGELASGELNLMVDPLDIEMSLLRQRLLRLIPYGEAPGLLELTRLAYRAVLEDLENLAGLTIDVRAADYAVLAGIQVHGPNRSGYIWSGRSYAVVREVKQDLILDFSLGSD
jgi:hypothetical protein